MPAPAATTPAYSTEQLKKLAEARHPEYKSEAENWVKWRKVYEGGPAFQREFIQQYSKRETQDDFDARRNITYNANHARSIVHMVRNAIAAKMSEVVRKGSPGYLKVMAEDVDLSRHSMATFLSTEVIPYLLAQRKVLVVWDAPAQPAPVTKAQVRGHPYCWAVKAEDCLAWHYDQDGRLDIVLLRETAETTLEAFGVAADTKTQYRYMRFWPSAPQVVPVGQTAADQVEVLVFNDQGEILDTASLPLPRLPVVEFKLAASLLADVAEMQVALLNLASTDMSFLYRGNFPIYAEQAGDRAIIPQAGTKAVPGSADAVLEAERRASKPVGTGTGVRYAKGANAPSFVAPPVENLRASMEKQQTIREEMRALCDLALTSLSVQAVEQSGKSKEADRVGEEAGLAYIGTCLESGERDCAEVFHAFEGTLSTARDVRYPAGYSLKTPADRRTEAGELSKLRGAVRSESYQKALQKRTAEVLLKPFISAEELAKIQGEVDAAVPFDDDTERADMLRQDVTAGLLSAETGSALRGYPKGEADKVLAEQSVKSSVVAGAQNFDVQNHQREPGGAGQVPAQGGNGSAPASAHPPAAKPPATAQAAGG